jgi:hypothetical protein
MNQKKPDPPPMAVTVLDAPQALEQMTRGEVEIQAMLAIRRPRDPDLAIQRTLAEATGDQQTAADCFYSIRKGGNLIEGPSVRLTEIAARCWGNLRAGSRIVDVGDTLVTAQGFAWDLETNFVCHQERQRRITDKHGRRYSDDVIVSTANAAGSIAFREAVIKAVGRTKLDPIWLKCKEVAVGESISLGDRYNAAIGHFAKAGVDEARVLAAIKRSRRSEVTPEDLAHLKGLATALKDGEISIDAAFPPPEDPATAIPKAGTSKIGRKPPNDAPRETSPQEPREAPGTVPAESPSEPETPEATEAPPGDSSTVPWTGGPPAWNEPDPADDPGEPPPPDLEAAGQGNLNGAGF